VSGTDSRAPGIAETHSAVLFFWGDKAVKVKKPVRLDVLDFSTPELREAALRRELELNRRLAPDVYQEVVSIVGSDGGVVDHALVMRRMPDERRLATLVASGADVDECLRAVARSVAAFHATARRAPEINGVAAPAAILARWEENFATLAELGGGVVDQESCVRIEHLTRRYLAGRSPLLASRIEHGWIRDGHGDLLATDIFCLDDGPRILDCIEFDDTLRWGDVLADVAFLAMHLESLGRDDLAAEFLDGYAEFSAERHPATLAAHYVSYRAHVRAKVACIRHSQGDPSAAAEAAHFLDVSRRNAETSRVRLVLVGGPPGTGKSTVATGLSDRLGWALLRSDEVRKDLAGVSHSHRADAAEAASLYGAAATEATYGTMLERAGKLLGLGECVVLDAQWPTAELRDRAAAVASAAAADLVSLRCDAPMDVVLARVALRTAAATDASDADRDVTTAATAAFEPWLGAIRIDTSGGPEAAVAAALQRVGEPHGT